MLEVIVASGVIVTAVSAALTLVQSSLSGAKTSEEQIIAYTLAQESVEVVRHMRDSNWLAGRDYDDGLYGDSYEFRAVPVFDAATKTWTLDHDISSSWDDNKIRVYKQVTNDGSVPAGMYLQADVQPDGSEVTRFIRRLTFRRICSKADGTTDNYISYERLSVAAPCPVGQENIGIEINSYVRWLNPSGEYNTVRLMERLFDWR
jgi:hypothetical protein